MRANCHVSFDGQCEAAFRFYQHLLGGAIATMLTYGESPMANQVPPEWQRRIVHATLVLDGHELLLGSDAFPNTYQRPQGFSVTLGLPDLTKAKEIFQALAEDGRVDLPFQQTFWSAGFGVVTDRFGVPWEVNCERPANSA
jgi:PhnB protein